MDKTVIAVVGSGYVGLVSAACFAEIGHHVICVDNDEEKVRLLNEGGIPIHEEYLPEMLGRHRRGNVEFTTDLHAATQRPRLSLSRSERRSPTRETPTSLMWTQWLARLRARSTATK